MRIVCPDCGAAYEVPENEIRPGRRLRCAGCGTVWPVAGSQAGVVSDAVRDAVPVGEGGTPVGTGLVTGLGGDPARGSARAGEPAPGASSSAAIVSGQPAVPAWGAREVPGVEAGTRAGRGLGGDPGRGSARAEEPAFGAAGTAATAAGRPAVPAGEPRGVPVAEAGTRAGSGVGGGMGREFERPDAPVWPFAPMSQPQRRARIGAIAIAWLSTLVILCAVVALAVIYRHAIERAWPPSLRGYEAVGLED